MFYSVDGLLIFYESGKLIKTKHLIRPPNIISRNPLITKIL